MNLVPVGVVVESVHENQRGEINVSATTGALNTGGGKPGQGYPLVVSTVQGGGRRGYRIDAESAAGGHLIPVSGDGVDQ